MGVRLRGFARQFATVASRIIPATPTNLRLITRGSENLFLGRRYWAQRDKDELRDLSAYVGCVCKMGGELLSSVWALVLKEWALQQQDDAKCAIIIVAVLIFPNISVFGNFPQWWFCGYADFSELIINKRFLSSEFHSIMMRMWVEVV